MEKVHQLWLAFLLFMILLSGRFVDAQESDPAGRVTLALGEVGVLRGNYSRLDIIRRSEVFEGDIIETAIKLTTQSSDFAVSAYDSAISYIAAFNGGITIESPGGSLSLGVGADFDFAQIAADNQPEGLRQYPNLSQVGGGCAQAASLIVPGV